MDFYFNIENKHFYDYELKQNQDIYSYIKTFNINKYDCFVGIANNIEELYNAYSRKDHIIILCKKNSILENLKKSILDQINDIQDDNNKYNLEDKCYLYFRISKEADSNYYLEEILKVLMSFSIGILFCYDIVYYILRTIKI